MAIETGSLPVEWIIKFEDTSPPVKLGDCIDRTKDARRCGLAACVFAFLPLNSDDRSTNSGTRNSLRNIFAAHIELVSWREFIKRGVPLGARIRFVRQDKLAVRCRHSQRPRPWIQLRVLNDLEKAADPKIIIANGRRVRGIP